MQNYYVAKEPNTESLARFNPHVITDVDQYRSQMDPFIELLGRFSGPVIYHKGKYIPTDEYNKNKFMSMSGSHIIAEATGEKLNDYEYSHLILQNKACSVDRQTSALQMPDP